MRFADLVRPIRTRIASGEEYLEAWKADHELAKSVYRLEDQLDTFTRTYDELRRVQTAYQNAIVKDSRRYEATVEDLIRLVWQFWLVTANSLEKERLLLLEGQFDSIGGANEFRSRLAAAREDEKFGFLQETIQRTQQLTDEVCDSIGFQNR